jgi:hypothetical protein
LGNFCSLNDRLLLQPTVITIVNKQNQFWYGY